MRCAIVGSGTRNARAISTVVRPATDRSVSAICCVRGSTGWQHMNSRMSMSSASSVSAAGAVAGSVQVATVSSRRCLACSLRSRSVSRREATVMSHAFGFPGTPVSGHVVAAAISASCTASSAVSKWP